MWIQAILTTQDLEQVLEQLTPLKVILSEDGPARHLYLGRPERVELVPGEGLRVVCQARVRLAVVGLKVPVKLHTLKVMLRPYIRRSEASASSDGVVHGKHDVLAFRLRIEEADLKAIPTFIDERIVGAVNTALKGVDHDLAWDFSETLSFQFALPKAMAPTRRFDLTVAWGEVKVTSEAVVLAVSFHTRVPRGEVKSVVDGQSDDQRESSQAAT